MPSRPPPRRLPRRAVLDVHRQRQAPLPHDRDGIYKTSAKGVNLGDWMGRVAGNLTDDDARVDCCA